MVVVVLLLHALSCRILFFVRRCPTLQDFCSRTMAGALVMITVKVLGVMRELCSVSVVVVVLLVLVLVVALVVASAGRIILQKRNGINQIALRNRIIE